MSETPAAGVRVDKWLWAARFFKTRSVAATAVSGGHVYIDGQRVKRLCHRRGTAFVGQTVDITRGEVEFSVVVEALADKRGPAAVAQTLYQETEQSIARREAAAAARKAQRELRAASAGLSLIHI